MTSTFTLLRAINRACQSNDISPTRFGRAAVGDPRLVADLRSGRELRPATAAKIRSYLATLGDEDA